MITLDFSSTATNITRQLRGRWIELFADYNARVEIVYLEPTLRTILMQNQRRPNPVPEKVIERLQDRLEPPTITECHALTIAELATP
jgi:tRNA uridine 5-carbamoylmethylation protein Kti12